MIKKEKKLGRVKSLDLDQKRSKDGVRRRLVAWAKVLRWGWSLIWGCDRGCSQVSIQGQPMTGTASSHDLITFDLWLWHKSPMGMYRRERCPWPP
jgi:hypothetical protein